MRKWGLALGGGGVYGLAHIGVLQVLERYGLVPDAIAGTSAGALVAGLWASGVDLTRIEVETTEALLADESYEATVQPVSMSMNVTQMGITGLVRGGFIESTVDRLTGGAYLRDARIPLAITSVDVVTGSLVIFTNDPPRKRSMVESLAAMGRLYVTDAKISEAARASISIPGVFTPKPFGEFTLVDGGIRDMVPVFEVRRMGVSEAVGVDLGLHVDRPHKPSSLVSVVSRSFSLSARETTQRNLQEYATLTLQPDVMSVTGLLSRAKVRNLISAGRVCAERALGRLCRIVS
ncbi:MAG: patatin-like phospholipase family protein [Bacillota bacterium]